MASDLYLKLDGIPGESTDKQFEGQIEIESFSFGASQSGTVASSAAGGITGARADLTDLSISKQLDASSSVLFKYCTTGKRIATATISVCGANESKKVYLQYDLTDVLISSIQLSGSSGGMRPSESVSLRFSKIVMTYNPLKNTGADNTTYTAGWNAETNEAM